MYQQWTEGLNPRLPLGLTRPMWISFSDLPLEYRKIAQKVAEHVGSVFAESHEGGFECPPQFCVGIDLQRGWLSNVVSFSECGGSASVTVRYEDVVLYCSQCRNQQHAEEHYPHPRTSLSRDGLRPVHQSPEHGRPCSSTQYMSPTL